MKVRTDPALGSWPGPVDAQKVARKNVGAKNDLVTVFYLADPRTAEVFHVGFAAKPRERLSKLVYDAKRGRPGPVSDVLRQLLAFNLKPPLTHVVQLHPSRAPAEVERLKQVLHVKQPPRRPGGPIATPRSARKHLKTASFTPLAPCPNALGIDRFTQRVMRDLRQYGPRPQRSRSAESKT